MTFMVAELRHPASSPREAPQASEPLLQGGGFPLQTKAGLCEGGLSSTHFGGQRGSPLAAPRTSWRTGAEAHAPSSSRAGQYGRQHPGTATRPPPPAAAAQAPPPRRHRPLDAQAPPLATTQPPGPRPSRAAGPAFPLNHAPQATPGSRLGHAPLRPRSAPQVHTPPRRDTGPEPFPYPQGLRQTTAPTA